MLRKNKHLELSNRATCLYNKELPCTEKIKIWLSPEEHHTVKTMRLMLNISVSYLIYKAINLYLESILRQFLFARNKHRPNNKYKLWQQQTENYLKHIHRKISFSSRCIIGLRLIIPLPKKLCPRISTLSTNIWKKYIQ